MAVNKCLRNDVHSLYCTYDVKERPITRANVTVLQKGRPRPFSNSFYCICIYPRVYNNCSLHSIRRDNYLLIYNKVIFSK